MNAKYLTLIGTTLTLALTTNAAFAESSKSPIAQSDSLSMNPAAEIKLSPAGMKILCERSPLNSRCPEGQALVPGASGNTSVPLLESNPTLQNAEPLMLDGYQPNQDLMPAPQDFMHQELDFPATEISPQ